MLDRYQKKIDNRLLIARQGYKYSAQNRSPQCEIKAGKRPQADKKQAKAGKKNKKEHPQVTFGEKMQDIL